MKKILPGKLHSLFDLAHFYFATTHFFYNNDKVIIKRSGKISVFLYYGIMFDMIKNLGNLQKDIESFTENLQKQEFEASSGQSDKQVKVILGGDMNIKKIEIADEFLNPDVKDELIYHLIDAMKIAQNQSRLSSQQHLKEKFGNLPIPGIEKLLNR